MPNYCTNYRGALDDVERKLDYLTQVISVPELKSVIRQINLYVMSCRKCGERVRTAPRNRSNSVVYASTVKSLVVYMNIVMFLPYNSFEAYLRNVFGLTPSAGSLVNLLMKTKRKAAPAIEKIKELIMYSSVVGFDESGYSIRHRPIYHRN